jgi:DNA-binding response OmpR family regulator
VDPKKKILIVEDDLDYRTGLGIRLRAAGYVAVFAADGASAVGTAQRERPDLIVLDLGLPGGDGFVVLERLRAISHLGAIPVIVVSARDPIDVERRALQLGATVFYQKPVDSAQLMHAVKEVLGA